MIWPFGRVHLDGILAKFHKLVAQLENHIEALEAEITGHKGDAVVSQQLADSKTVEQARAMRVSENVQKLIA